MSAGKYYILRWHVEGGRTDGMIASGGTVRIGETASCDVRLANPGPFADEVFCTIKPTRSGEGWLLIPQSEFVPVYAGGSPVTLVHYLESGDRISFGETDAELTFDVRSDGRYSPGSGTVRIGAVSRRPLVMLAAAIALVLLLVLGAIFVPRFNAGKVHSALEAAKSSVFKIQVDSVYLVRYVSGVADTLGRAAVKPVGGTAFVTSDGQLLTARHCIEPWLNQRIFEVLRLPESRQPADVRYALEAETYNQTHNCDTAYRAVARCVLFNGDAEETGVFHSSDFRYDSTRDEVFEAGDYTHEYYWRSVVSRHGRRDMMLGDAAVLDGSGLRGSIVPAPAGKLQQWLKEGSELHFFGYQEKFIQTGLEGTPGTLKFPYRPGRMLSHDGQIVTGYSGGPVLYVHGNKVYAVGVISVVDAGGAERKYSVPISEIPL